MRTLVVNVCMHAHIIIRVTRYCRLLCVQHVNNHTVLHSVFLCVCMNHIRIRSESRLLQGFLNQTEYKKVFFSIYSRLIVCKHGYIRLVSVGNAC